MRSEPARRAAAIALCDGRPTKSRKSGCGRVGRRLELGVELRGHEERVVRQLEHLDEVLGREHARDAQAGGLELRAQVALLTS